jgi:hypothetical protein
VLTRVALPQRSSGTHLTSSICTDRATSSSCLASGLQARDGRARPLSSNFSPRLHIPTLPEHPIRPLLSASSGAFRAADPGVSAGASVRCHEHLVQFSEQRFHRPEHLFQRAAQGADTPAQRADAAECGAREVPKPMAPGNVGVNTGRSHAADQLPSFASTIWVSAMSTKAAGHPRAGSESRSRKRRLPVSGRSCRPATEAVWKRAHLKLRRLTPT